MLTLTELNFFLTGLYQKNAKILLLGLDDSGKTTLLGMLKYGRLVVSYPTQKPSTMSSHEFTDEMKT